MTKHGTTMTLDDSTVENAGYACYNQVKTMGDLFAELLELYVAEKRK
jgi:hypothetical protein